MVRTEAKIREAGFTILSSQFRSGEDGKIGQANYNLQYGSDPDMGLMVTWQNSYNKTMSFKYAVGTHVFVCANGMVAGNMGAYKRVHSGTADHDSFDKIQQYLANAEETFQELVVMKNKTKEVELNKKQMAEIAGRWFVQDNIVTATQLGIIKGEIENPSFNYGTGNSTMWDLYNAATHSFKKDHPMNWMNRHLNLSKWTVDEFGLSKPEATQVFMPPAYEEVFLETN